VILIATSGAGRRGRPLTRLTSPSSSRRRAREIGGFGGGGRVGLRLFLESDRWASYTREASRQAVVKLAAITPRRDR
jgi:hypothetical protein